MIEPINRSPSSKAERPISGSLSRQRLVNIVGGSAGNLVEWFDWYVYAAFALYFAPSFFPKGDQTAQLLSTAAVFAVGFVMRPIGGVGDGHLCGSSTGARPGSPCRSA